ncbi:MAG: hypothetical protein NC416_07205 [Eubacterium sp.]|nr:hypothetical protein [Eubacterium sp.]
MEERKTIFDYIGHVFLTFGFSIVALNIFCILVGEDAQEVSSIYSMGKEGLAVATMMQFFGVSACITGLQAFFFTDVIIKRMSIAMRMVCMLTSIVAVIAVCATVFDWFPVTMWQAWAGFFITFALCFAGSLFFVTLKEKTENRRMEEALQRLKEQNESADEKSKAKAE